MRGPPGPAGMTGRSGPVVSRFWRPSTRRLVHSIDLLTVSSARFTVYEKHIWWSVFASCEGINFEHLSFPNTYLFSTCICTDSYIHHHPSCLSVSRFDIISSYRYSWEHISLIHCLQAWFYTSSRILLKVSLLHIYNLDFNFYTMSVDYNGFLAKWRHYQLFLLCYRHVSSSVFILLDREVLVPLDLKVTVVILDHRWEE